MSDWLLLKSLLPSSNLISVILLFVFLHHTGIVCWPEDISRECVMHIGNAFHVKLNVMIRFDRVSGIKNVPT